MRKRRVGRRREVLKKEEERDGEIHLSKIGE